MITPNEYLKIVLIFSLIIFMTKKRKKKDCNEILRIVKIKK
jgi:hypothetical protein